MKSRKFRLSTLNVDIHIVTLSSVKSFGLLGVNQFVSFIQALITRTTFS